MANTIATSTIAYPTGPTPNQLTVMSPSGDALVIWCDGTNAKYSYAASTNYASWTTTTLQSSVGSYWQAGCYQYASGDALVVSCDSSHNIKSIYMTYSSGGHSWSAGSAVTVLNGSGYGFNPASVCMDVDAQGRIWLAYGGYVSANLAEVFYTSNNGTSWTSSTTFTISGSQSMLIGIAYCGNYIVVLYCSINSSPYFYYARVDAHAASIGSWSTPAGVTNCIMDNGAEGICFRGGPSSNYGVFVGDKGSAIPAQVYNASNDTWSSITNIGASSNDKKPNLISDGTNLYCLWCLYTAANNFSLVYKKWTTSNQTWDGSSTQLEANGTNIQYPSAGYGNSILGFVYTVGTANPWTVYFDTKSFSSGVALSGTLAGVGTIAGTITGPLASATLAGVGTLAGTTSLSTALTDTLAGVGTLSGTITGPLSPTTLAGTGTLTGTASLSTAFTSTLAGVGTLTGTLSTSGNVALSGTYAGVGTLTGTMSLATALTDTLAGVGTLVPTLTASITLSSVTIPGVGTLSGTAALSTALVVTEAGVGTLTGTTSLNTALAVTIPGTGTISGTLSAGNTVALSGTLTGVGTMTATMTESTALSSAIPGAGTLSGTLSANIILSSAMLVSAGTLSGTMAMSTALSGTCAGVGTLSGTFSLAAALSLTFAGIGMLSGALSIPATHFMTAIVWMTRDLQVTWQTRDDQATWTTRGS